MPRTELKLFTQRPDGTTEAWEEDPTSHAHCHESPIHGVVAGGFDPLHIGHLHHIQLAAMYCTNLTVITHPDDILVAKKGYCFMPLLQRTAILCAIRWVGRVVVSIDTDGTVAETLRLLKPNIFFKGGDRTPDNMPLNEIEACRTIGCTIWYGVGTQQDSSSDLVKQAATTIAQVGF